MSLLLIKKPWISMLKILNQIEIIVNYSIIISVFALSVWNIVNYSIELKKYKFLLVENVNPDGWKTLKKVQFFYKINIIS